MVYSQTYLYLSQLKVFQSNLFNRFSRFFSLKVLKDVKKQFFQMCIDDSYIQATILLYKSF